MYFRYITAGLILVSILFPSIGTGQSNDPFAYAGIGIEWGSWHPNNLRIAGHGLSLKSMNDNLYISGFALAPVANGFALRFTVGYFRHTAPDKSYKTIELMPILLDIKYQLIAESRLSPYVSYGISSCAGQQSPKKDNEYDLGYGLNFGTGFDLLMSRRIALGCEFRYHYLRFEKPMVITDDFSGPKVNVSLYYLFK
ncbi:hypothetical protein JW960_23420 [candidate division KSB1 bacterium]|nr:hypothetical protein [candidate division KSB1 bacterium]